jgi:hypothetical protein
VGKPDRRTFVKTLGQGALAVGVIPQVASTNVYTEETKIRKANGASAAKTEWYFPDAYLPDTSTNISHEAVCVLNTSSQDANLIITMYYLDQEPVTGFQVACPSKRSKHIRTDALKNKSGETVKERVPYAIHVSSDIPVMCQYTRVDATKPAYTLMTTMGL